MLGVPPGLLRDALPVPSTISREVGGYAALFAFVYMRGFGQQGSWRVARCGGEVGGTNISRNASKKAIMK